MIRVATLAILLLLPLEPQGTTSRETIGSDWCRVVFHPGDRGRALEFLRAAAPARARIVQRLGFDLKEPVTVWVARDQDDLRSEVLARIGREPPDWAGGLAIKEMSLVLVRADLPGEPFDRVDAIIGHELAHVAIGRATQASGVRLPRWFEEGLAQWIAGRARPLDVPDLRPAATFGWLLDLAAMDAAFSHGEGAAARAYAQAESFVRFVARRGGSTAVRRTLERMLDGVALDRALHVETGADLASTWAAWKVDLASDRSWMLTTGLQMLVAVLLLVVVGLGLTRIIRRRRTIEAKWDREPEPGDAP